MSLLGISNILVTHLGTRNAHPPYGFYILNRMGMDDYIQRMYPEDDMNILGEYLMYKCYPDYTALRLGMPLDRDADPELATNKHKGKAITVGLWMFATDSREPMKDVLMRFDLLDVQSFG